MPGYRKRGGKAVRIAIGLGDADWEFAKINLPMTLTNHMLSGSVLAKLLPLPIAIPAAIASHFVLDVLPHFGFKTLDEYKGRSRYWRGVLLADFVIALVISWQFLHTGHLAWFLIGFLAYAPDLIWLNWLYHTALGSKSNKHVWSASNWLTRFHENVQHYERPWGVLVEVALGVTLLYVLR